MDETVHVSNCGKHSKHLSDPSVSNNKKSHAKQRRAVEPNLADNNIPVTVSTSSALDNRHDSSMFPFPSRSESKRNAPSRCGAPGEKKFEKKSKRQFSTENWAKQRTLIETSNCASNKHGQL